LMLVRQDPAVPRGRGTMAVVVGTKRDVDGERVTDARCGLAFEPGDESYPPVGGELATDPRPVIRPEVVEIYGERLDVLRREYTTLVPFRYLSRCPYTGALVSWPIDDVDLDGWYWWYDAPARQLPRVPPTWLAMTGALRLGQPVAAAPFVCRPGPGAPFVVPALLRDGQATAVISEVPVGQHTGWAITYFGTAPAAAAKQVNLWGTGWSPVPDGAGGWVEQAAPAADGVERDFDLEPWLATGRLLWIAPGDQSLEPRKGVADCPYLDLEGPRESPTIRDGV